MRWLAISVTFFHAFCQKKGCCKALDYLSEYPKRLGQTFQKKKGVDVMDILTSGLWNHQKENVICSKYSVWYVGGQRQEVFDGKNDSGW